MYYFVHGTLLRSVKNILKTGYIYAAYYLKDRKYIVTTQTHETDSKYVFTNIYDDLLLKSLKPDETMAFGQITFIIDPIILEHKICYFNPGLVSVVNKDSIVMNKNVPHVLSLVKKNYKYPFILTQEALFYKRISMKYVIGIITNEKNRQHVQKYLDKYGYDLPIYDKLPPGSIVFE